MVETRTSTKSFFSIGSSDSDASTSIVTGTTPQPGFNAVLGASLLQRPMLIYDAPLDCFLKCARYPTLL